MYFWAKRATCHHVVGWNLKRDDVRIEFRQRRAESEHTADAVIFVMHVRKQVLAYALMAAGAAGAGAAVIIKRGEAGWKCSGSGFESFCSKGDAAVAMTFIAFVCLGASALLYTFRLYRVAKMWRH